LTDTNRQINALLHEIDIAVAHDGVYANARVIAHVTSDRASQMESRKTGGYRNPQRALRRGLELSGFALRLFELFQDASTALIISTAHVRQMQPSCGAL
jgi:hypothetical protein